MFIANQRAQTVKRVVVTFPIYSKSAHTIFLDFLSFFRVQLLITLYNNILNKEMEKPPLKKKKLIERDSDSDDGGFDIPSTLSSDRSDKKVSFAPSSSQTTPPPQTSQPTEEQVDSDNNNKKRQPRLVMKKMILNNFKSYAGRQVIGPFHKVNIYQEHSLFSSI